MPEHRTEKQKQSDHKLATDAINYIKPTMTGPHIAVDEMLDNLNVKYENEHKIKYYLMDIYLPEYSLGIEINGDFWHANPLRYSEINYTQQEASIRRDKSKHTYVKNKYGFEILYLWERDIEKNPEMCKKLIEKYTSNNGVLENYNSFNYHLSDDEELVLNDNIILSFAQRNRKDIIFGERVLENKKAS